jgi:hypothetical protein
MLNSPATELLKIDTDEFDQISRLKTSRFMLGRSTMDFTSMFEEKPSWTK